MIAGCTAARWEPNEPQQSRASEGGARIHDGSCNGKYTAELIPWAPWHVKVAVGREPHWVMQPRSFIRWSTIDPRTGVAASAKQGREAEEQQETRAARAASSADPAAASR